MYTKLKRVVAKKFFRNEVEKLCNVLAQTFDENDDWNIFNMQLKSKILA